jgi:methionyl-tRNA formyltransferase
LTHSKAQPSWTAEAYTFLGGRKVRVWQATVADERWSKAGAEPGQILAILGQGLLVQAGQGAVIVADADIEGAEAKGLAGVLEALSAGLPAYFG